MQHQQRRVMAWDLDDTIYDTKTNIIKTLIRKGDVPSELIEEAMSLKDRKLPLQHASPELSKYIWNDVISNHNFMLYAGLLPYVQDNLNGFCGLLRDLRHAGVLNVVVSHRGYLERALVSSVQSLSRYGIMSWLDDVHIIKSTEHPNKFEFIKARYGDDFMLADDNPIHQSLTNPSGRKVNKDEINSDVVKANALVCRANNLFNEFSHLKGYVTFKEMEKHIRERFSI